MTPTLMFASLLETVPGGRLETAEDDEGSLLLRIVVDGVSAGGDATADCRPDLSISDR